MTTVNWYAYVIIAFGFLLFRTWPLRLTAGGFCLMMLSALMPLLSGIDVFMAKFVHGELVKMWNIAVRGEVPQYGRRWDVRPVIAYGLLCAPLFPIFLAVVGRQEWQSQREFWSRPYQWWLDRRERRRLAVEESRFYYQQGGVAYAGQGMTVNVRTPVTWSEWVRRCYWVLRFFALLVPVMWMVGGLEPFMRMIAAAIPVPLKARLADLLGWLQGLLV